MKSIFKNTTLLLLIVLGLSFNANAQRRNCCADFNWIIGVAQDVKMSYQGAHGQGGQLNPEITFGVDFENVRFTMKYEWYSSIQYRKWTVIAGDYKPRLFNNERIETLIGLEVNLIYRYDPVPEIYNDNLSAGANAEIVYWFTDHIGVNANTNLFTAEANDNFGNEMKKYRWDVRLGLTFKL